MAHVVLHRNSQAPVDLTKLGATRGSWIGRWWVYQAKRFPVGPHGLLIAAFSLSAITFSTLLRGDVSLPHPLVALVGSTSAFLFFLQLRIADEFKDAGEDARYRPYRPVPRGLVSLRELAMKIGRAHV